ncbi:MAG: hypothetical protein M1837_003399 [Sclerophora amabilis]|nr:MAG: hypothetical protein M1837_003399 [Sclerophora amabilis]
MASQRLFLPLLQRLPFGLGSFTRYNVLGWLFNDKYRMHVDFGDAWVHVSPGENALYVANAEAVEEIFLRRKDFPKPSHMYKMLEIFGRNINTIEGQEWQRHRKITGPAFNERNNHLVWAEAMRQARGMLGWWTRKDQNGISTTDKDTRILSLHVLTCAGFGMSYSFRSAMDAPQAGFTMTYRDALALILEHALIVIAFPHKVLSLPFVPAKWKAVGRATREFRAYMANMLEKEKNLISRRASGADNLMSALVRGSEEARQAQQKDNSSSKSGTGSQHESQGLTDQEIIGNVFLYNFAGHETTGNILAYCILLLAAYPQWQEWISEEIQHVVKDGPKTETWDYHQSFPRLKRCLAILLESLRLFSPVCAIPKYTANQQQTLKINDEVHVIPPKTMVFPNAFALHTHPRYWGDDSLTWRPSRWIVAPSSSASSRPSSNGSEQNAPSMEEETIFEPRRGTYIPWSEGERICPGKKFAQVEFVATIAVLFRSHRVRPIRRSGETQAEAAQRVLDVVEDSDVGLTLQMQHPSQVSVEWIEKE